MVATVLDGQRSWTVSRDEDGHRNYKITHMVSHAVADGPAIVLSAAGLPTVGSFWSFDNDVDAWAFCTPQASVKPAPGYKKGEPYTKSEVTQIFTTKPNESERKRCWDTTIEDPLLEPMGVSGSFVKYTREATLSADGPGTAEAVPLKNSAHEMFRGPAVEVDDHRARVNISQNVLNLDLPTVTELMNTVNDAVLWGLPLRCVKFSDFSWERNVYGVCNYYYTRNMGFDIDFKTFDRDILDEGTKVVYGLYDEDTWVQKTHMPDGTPVDVNNPQHFVRFKTIDGELARVVLDGNGMPATEDADIFTHTFQMYEMANLLLLGIPTSL